VPVAVAPAGAEALSVEGLSMIDLETIKTLSALGVGGLLATVIFVFYRQDFLRERESARDERERRERREDRLLQVIERNAAASERLAVTIERLGVSLGDHHGS
jgi:hypothetical protein